MTFDEVIQELKDIWNQSAFPKILAGLIGFGLFLLLATFLAPLLGLIAVAVVIYILWWTWIRKS